MPLIKGKSQKSFVKNLKTELHEGKPMKNSLAIAYSMKRKAMKKKMAEGGSVTPTESAQESMRKAFHFADGGEVKEKPMGLADEAMHFFKKATGQEEQEQTQSSLEDKYEKVREQNKKNFGYAHGGSVYDVTSPDKLLKMQEEPGYVPSQPDYDWVPGVKDPRNVAASHEDGKKLNQHSVDMQASTSMAEEDLVDRIMNKKSKNLSGLDRLAKGGPVDASMGNGPYEDDEDDMVSRIMHKRNEPFSDLDRYSEGGKVANNVGYGQEADKLPNQYDDLVLRDDLESTYGDDDNSGDALGNDQEDQDQKDIVARIMASRRKKDRLPNPA